MENSVVSGSEFAELRTLVIGTSVVQHGLGFYGGVEKMALDLAEGLAGAGCKTTIACPKGSQIPISLTWIPTVALPDQQDRDDLALVRIYERGGFQGYDAVVDFSHGHFMARADPTNPDWARQVRALPMLNLIWDNITVRYAKASFNIGCCSEWQAERFKALYGQDAKVVPKWGYVSGRRYKPAKNPKRERLLFVGKLSPEKGALQAVELARTAGVGLDVVGGLIPTDSRAFAQELRHLNDGKQVRFYENADELHKIDLMKNAKAVIYPVQFDEAHCLVAIEAAAVQTPFIQYRRGGIGASPELQAQLGCKMVDTREEFLKAATDLSWFEPTKEDWTVEGRVPEWLKFLKEIQDGLRW